MTCRKQIILDIDCYSEPQVTHLRGHKSASKTDERIESKDANKVHCDYNAIRLKYCHCVSP
jgi:phosphoribosyl 1,2-cyclic phosphodiesterase